MASYSKTDGRKLASLEEQSFKPQYNADFVVAGIASNSVAGAHSKGTSAIVKL